MMAYAYLYLRQGRSRFEKSLDPLRLAIGRLRYLLPFRRRFTGAYASLDEAMRAARASGLAGYDNDEVADINFEQMCRVTPWDYPILFWMRHLIHDVDGVIDAGGHMGTKYLAFRRLLPLDPAFRWVVYDLPAIVRAGRRRAEREKLTSLTFVDRLEDAGEMPLFLGSGLLQYLDVPLPDLLRRMPKLPPHLLLNKVAMRDGPTVVTLEGIGKARVPYQIRNESSFISEIVALGYDLVDRWPIPALSAVIDTHPELGASKSAGFYFRLAQS